MKSLTFLSKDDSTDIKGIACLMIIFSHIGYFLFPNTNFLFPLSIFAGIGVDIFLLLSGYGLAQSNNQEIGLFDFYKKRLSRLFIPIWTATGLIVILDLFTKALTPTKEGLLHILPSITGIVPTANIYSDFNSPLWFITLIILFYIAFPIFYKKEKPLWSIFLLFAFAYVVPPFISSTLFPSLGNLYSTHLFAFPLGVALAFLNQYWAKDNRATLDRGARLGIFVGAVAIFIYFALNSFQGFWLQQPVSIIASLAFIIAYTLLPFRIKAIHILGLYSFEIFLIHWPILYRHDFLYSWLPAWIATILYIPIFLLIAVYLRKVSEKIKPPGL